jgi:hypothetical protein
VPSDHPIGTLADIADHVSFGVAFQALEGVALLAEWEGAGAGLTGSGRALVVADYLQSGSEVICG